MHPYGTPVLHSERRKCPDKCLPSLQSSCLVEYSPLNVGCSTLVKFADREDDPRRFDGWFENVEDAAFSPAIDCS